MGNLDPKIYVACLAAYNNGYLHGRWINANQDIDSICEAISSMLAKSPIAGAEEWAIHDDEGFGEGLIFENTGLKRITELAEFLVKYSELGEEVLSHFGGDIDSARRALEEEYHGEFSNEKDFAHYWLHEVDGREIPDYLKNYIDYEAMAYDFFINDFFSVEVNHKTHVFSNV